MCSSIEIAPIERWALLSIRVLNASTSDGLLHIKEGESVFLNSVLSASASGKEDRELFEMNISAMAGSREGQIWFSNVSSIAHAPVTVFGSGTALLRLVGAPKDLTFLLEHISFQPPHLFNGVAWLKLSFGTVGYSSSSIMSSKTVPVAVDAVNNPPQIKVTSAIFYGLQGQIIEIGFCGMYVTDPDAHETGFSASLNVMVSIVDGRRTLELSQYSPKIANMLEVFFNSNSITPVGPIQALNVALTSLMFIPDPDWSGVARIHLEADDLGHTGLGGPQQAIPVELGVHVAATIVPPRIIAPQYYSGFQGQVIELQNVTIMDEGPDSSEKIQLCISSTEGKRQPS